MFISASNAAWIMSMMARKVVTPDKLLPAELLEGVIEIAPKFKSKEDWERHKAGIKKMAKMHEQVVKEIKAGIKKPITVVSFAPGPKPKVKENGD